MIITIKIIILLIIFFFCIIPHWGNSLCRPQEKRHGVMARTRTSDLSIKRPALPLELIFQPDVGVYPKYSPSFKVAEYTWVFPEDLYKKCIDRKVQQV
jgi:hypothetical protein